MKRILFLCAVLLIAVYFFFSFEISFSQTTKREYARSYTNTTKAAPAAPAAPNTKDKAKIIESLRWKRPRNLDVMPNLTWGKTFTFPYYPWSLTAPALQSHSREFVRTLLSELNTRQQTQWELVEVENTDMRYDFDANGVRFWFQCTLSEGGTHFKQTLTAFREFQPSATLLEVGHGGAASSANEPRPQKPFIQVTVISFNRSPHVLKLAESLQKAVHEANDDRVGLLVVDFNSTDAHLPTLLENITIPITVKVIDEPFTRSLARHSAVTAVEDPNTIVFMCDADMSIPTPLLERLRMFVKQGQSAYSPICYYLMNDPPIGIPLYHGGWGFPGVGNIAFYRSDYNLTEGFNLKIKQWGNEDIEFATALMGAGIEVISAYEKDFIHHPHGWSP